MANRSPEVAQAEALFRELRKKQRPRTADDLAGLLVVPYAFSIFADMEARYSADFMVSLYDEAYRLVVTLAYFVACSAHYSGVRSVEAIGEVLNAEPESVCRIIFDMGARGEMPPVFGLRSLALCVKEAEFRMVLAAATTIYPME